VAAVVLAAHDNHAVMLLVDQVVGQRQIVGDDLHRFAAQFPTQQKGGGAAVDDDALTRISCEAARAIRTFSSRFCAWWIFIGVQRGRCSLSFRAIANLFQFAAFIQLVDITSGGSG
jgi:hypothetical protein